MNTTSKLLEAISFATLKHAGQTRKSTTHKNVPYMVHPLEAAAILAECGYQDEHDLLISAVLHDVLEDTETTEDELKFKFGLKVLNTVKECTDDPTIDKMAQKQNQITSMPNKSIEGQLVKIADKTSNLRDIIRIRPNWKPESFIKYINQARQVVKASSLINFNGNPCERKLLECFWKAADDAELATCEEIKRSENV